MDRSAQLTESIRAAGGAWAHQSVAQAVAPGGHVGSRRWGLRWASAAEGHRTSPESSPGGQKGPRVGAFEWGEDAASIGGKATAGLGRKRRRRAAEAAGWFGRETTWRLRA